MPQVVIEHPYYNLTLPIAYPHGLSQVSVYAISLSLNSKPASQCCLTQLANEYRHGYHYLK
jgi:hypothetical protein